MWASDLVASHEKGTGRDNGAQMRSMECRVKRQFEGADSPKISDRKNVQDLLRGGIYIGSMVQYVVCFIY